MKIERLIHQAWFGGDIPPHLAAYSQTWSKLHPAWAMCRWNDITLPRLINQSLFDQAPDIAPNNIGQFKADILRYELLWRYGGMWVDYDFEAQKPIDGLIADVECFAAWEQDGVWVNNAILGSVPKHPFMKRCIDELEDSVRANPGARPNVMTGPQYMTKLYRDDPTGVVVFPQKLFYPYSWNELHRQGEEFPEAYCVHHWANARRRKSRT